MNALLVLEDGTVFKGQSFGAPGETTGEVVFNTSMTGYQEILTDPSYKGQIVTMTYPLIGNYGINSDDIEARKMFLEGFVVKECSQVASNWRAERSLDEYLRQQNIIGIQGVDTRAITKHIRVAGAMKGIISTKSDDIDTLLNKLKKAPDLVGRDLVKEVTIKEKYNWESQGKGQYKVVLVDCGAKYNIMRELVKRDCEVIVVPAETTAEEILKLQPNGLMLSNGPGDPEAVTYVVKTVKNLLGKVPIFGICLGHQMLGQALGGKTYKLKFGHHGANHPVIDLRTGKIAITVQNHGFCMEMKEKDNHYYFAANEAVTVTHINLNDRTCEGIRHTKLPAFSVQFHPEASPGPNDAKYLFDEFIDLMNKSTNNTN